MAERVRGDTFDRARLVAVVMMVVASAAAFAGALMNWTTRGVLPPLPDTTFEGEPPQPTEPITGVEAGDGNIIIVAAILMLIGATLLGVRRRSAWAWLSFLGSVVAGGIAIAAWRGIDDINSGFSQRADVIGDIDPAAGLVVVAVAAFTGLVGSILGIVATPEVEA
ncbi:MAG TPA: LPXTG cell wall anchor domain-containing protein [Actinomycetota bacterium]|jgi:LPXTG-motif cell wall-anchored protein|nr:LPXTG cell wall anchor domain-containing protein [Actinomycetota bacterium]